MVAQVLADVELIWSNWHHYYFGQDDKGLLRKCDKLLQTFKHKAARYGLTWVTRDSSDATASATPPAAASTAERAHGPQLQKNVSGVKRQAHGSGGFSSSGDEGLQRPPKKQRSVLSSAPHVKPQRQAPAGPTSSSKGLKESLNPDDQLANVDADAEGKGIPLNPSATTATKPKRCEVCIKLKRGACGTIASPMKCRNRQKTGLPYFDEAAQSVIKPPGWVGPTHVDRHHRDKKGLGAAEGLGAKGKGLAGGSKGLGSLEGGKSGKGTAAKPQLKALQHASKLAADADETLSSKQHGSKTKHSIEAAKGARPYQDNTTTTKQSKRAPSTGSNATTANATAAKAALASAERHLDELNAAYSKAVAKLEHTAVALRDAQSKKEQAVAAVRQELQAVQVEAARLPFLIEEAQVCMCVSWSR